MGYSIYKIFITSLYLLRPHVAIPLSRGYTKQTRLVCLAKTAKGGEQTAHKPQPDMTQDVIKYKTVLMKSSALYADTAIGLRDGKFCSH